MQHIPGSKITPTPMPGGLSVEALVDGYFPAYNSARLREACHLLKTKILKPNVTVGLSISGALGPAGLGVSVLAPLVKAGFIDWIVSTGANLYHDIHYGIGLDLYAASPFYDDVELREKNIIRIYDILFDFNVLHYTDKYLYHILEAPEFQRKMSTSEFHHHLGRYVAETQRKLGIPNDCLVAAAYKAGVPVYTSSPGDSTIGMNVAAKAFLDGRCEFDVSRDVNETTSIVYDAKRKGGMSAILMLGGGSPKNFVLQTEPQIQEILGLDEAGHDYFIQFTDARPDTGGLSGATPSEAVSWGKIDPGKLPDTVVCYTDSTIALPVFGAYALANCKKRKLSRLYDRRRELLADIQKEYLKHSSTFTGPQASGR